MTFISILFFLGVSFSGGLGEGPVWVATVAVFQWLGWVKTEVPIRACWFPVNLNAKVSVLFNLDCTVQGTPGGFL